VPTERVLVAGTGETDDILRIAFEIGPTHIRLVDLRSAD
jgi:uncharacterized DUF497 family protein